MTIIDNRASAPDERSKLAIRVQRMPSGTMSEDAVAELEDAVEVMRYQVKHLLAAAG